MSCYPRATRVAREPCQHPGHLRDLSWSEIRHGSQRPQRPALFFVPAKRPREGGRLRFRRRRSVPIATGRMRFWLPPTINLHLSLQRACYLREVSRRCEAGIHAEHPRPGHRARQQPGPGLAPIVTAFIPSRITRIPIPDLRQPREHHLRPLSRRRPPQRKNSESPAAVLPPTWPAITGWLPSSVPRSWPICGLPRRAQHFALQRRAIHHQPLQSGEHLRPVPSRSHREVCPQQGSRR